ARGDVADQAEVEEMIENLRCREYSQKYLALYHQYSQDPRRRHDALDCLGIVLQLGDETTRAEARALWAKEAASKAVLAGNLAASESPATPSAEPAVAAVF